MLTTINTDKKNQRAKQIEKIHHVHGLEVSIIKI
jgi:hypothetical protein